MGTDTREELDLVTDARRGSREAAGELFSRHWRGAWQTALAITGAEAAAEDCVQDAFERAFRALSNFDGRRPFGAWLHRIVVNRPLTLLRDERRLVALDGLPEEGADDPDAGGDRAPRLHRRAPARAAGGCDPPLRPRALGRRDRRAHRPARGDRPVAPCPGARPAS